jgi:pyruvate kinase
MRRTKIIATLGPATREPERVRSLIDAGVDVIRLNFAHPSPEVHREAAELARAKADEIGKVIGVLADLPGPKMRTGEVEGGEVSLEPGRPFVLFEKEAIGDGNGVSTTVSGLSKMVAPRDEVFLADGAIILRVTGIQNGDVHTEVVRRGLLRSRKGMHLPTAEAHIQAFTDEDRETLEFALSFKIDLVGLSFIRDAEDIERARAALPKRGVKPLLVAKIETRSAVENLDEVVRAADAVMVARGDLGIQCRFEDVPLLQKRIIRACNATGTPVITATQMLESMTHGPLPSRAEVNDVANAVLDGTDALMLSEETAVGKYPIATVRAMGSIAEAAESEALHEVSTVHHEGDDDPVSWAIARAAVHAAEELKVAAILCPTRSGNTARRVAAFRPSMPILGLSHGAETVRPLALVWGVVPALSPFFPEEQLAEEGLRQAVQTARDAGLVQSGQLVAVVAGGPAPRAGSTDVVRIVAT